jgi:ribosomal protein S18 acetylase RimI-like enzyme
VIRRARDTDAEAIARINALCFPGCDPRRASDLTWIDIERGRVRAFADARIVDGDTIYLSRCGVLPDARGLGLQRRLIRARLRGRRGPAVTYTAAWNCASSNNLIACGFRLYTPVRAWAGRDVLYWIRKSCVPRKI